MLPTMIAIVVIGIAAVQHRLTELCKNVDNAMNQIGVQLDCRFELLAKLLDVVSHCDGQEGEALIAMAEAGRHSITAQSAPAEIVAEEELIAEVLRRAEQIRERCPALQQEDRFSTAIKAVESYEAMLHTSQLIYNESAAKLNRELSAFPTNLIAGFLGFRKREPVATEG